MDQHVHCSSQCDATEQQRPKRHQEAQQSAYWQHLVPPRAYAARRSANEIQGSDLSLLSGVTTRRQLLVSGWRDAVRLSAPGTLTRQTNGRNLALELVALGYPNVSWYRGGLEAWDATGMPVHALH